MVTPGAHWEAARQGHKRPSRADAETQSGFFGGVFTDVFSGAIGFGDRFTFGVAFKYEPRKVPLTEEVAELAKS